MNVKDIEIGNWYHISGDIDNGTKDGKPYTSHDEVTRRIKRVTDTHIICECDRKFLINDNLKLSIPAFRRTDMANSVGAMVNYLSRNSPCRRKRGAFQG